MILSPIVQDIFNQACNSLDEGELNMLIEMLRIVAQAQQQANLDETPEEGMIDEAALELRVTQNEQGLPN